MASNRRDDEIAIRTGALDAHRSAHADALRTIHAWNARSAMESPLYFSPTIEAVMLTRLWWRPAMTVHEVLLKLRCQPRCQGQAGPPAPLKLDRW